VEQRHNSELRSLLSHTDCLRAELTLKKTRTCVLPNFGSTADDSYEIQDDVEETTDANREQTDTIYNQIIGLNRVNRLSFGF
jgi:hypothetical protein